MELMEEKSRLKITVSFECLNLVIHLNKINDITLIQLHYERKKELSRSCSVEIIAIFT